MIFSAIFTLLFTLPLAFAWTHHHVEVGPNSQLVYDPEYITADIGDKVTFRFHQKNHTVTQSSFQTPCTQIFDGFNSGFNPVGPDVYDNFPTVTLTVLVDTPLWFHCEQTGHCPQGMVFAINPPASGNTFDKFKAAALATAAPTGGSHARAEMARRFPRASLAPKDLAQ
ncbi:hypothetical protein BOTBODRAFT_498122 [Botryobasidium botryosum FD-172 SS1]|uniref:Phytocyanin domain-containing protein n=1 Tax=Botryobasidium botryosum (strain FD-172 SS1) TaxID=930990 RepID=A0A067M6L9_BOTB1|nr:hypothetical protein BOTBODRAFT_498122 [Botryobasidium botryosum FD-172 SS1]